MAEDRISKAIHQNQKECANVLENLISNIHTRPLFDEDERREYVSALRYAIAYLRGGYND